VNEGGMALVEHQSAGKYENLQRSPSQARFIARKESVSCTDYRSRLLGCLLGVRVFAPVISVDFGRLFARERFYNVVHGEDSE